MKVADGLDDAFQRLKDLKTLGLGGNASPVEIKQAYKELVQVWHPDRFEHDPRLRARAEEELTLINAAYERLLSGASGQPESQAASEPAGGSRESSPGGGYAYPGGPVPPPPPPGQPRQAAQAPSSSPPTAFVMLAIVMGLAIVIGIIAASGASQEQPSTSYTNPSVTTGAPIRSTPPATSASPSTGSQRDFRTPPAAPFWGAFVYASENQADVDSFAARLSASGFEPYILNTINYSSIGKPGQSILVITSGTWRSRDEAAVECSRLAAAGYSGAYPKIVEY